METPYLSNPLTLVVSRTLRRGDRGNDVKALQDRLITLGFLKGPSDTGFGPLTEAAVKAFQMAMGLKADGVAGKAVYAALTIDPAKPGDKVVAAPTTLRQYEAKFRAAKIRPEKFALIQKRAKLLLQYREKFYEPIAKAVGCPWFVVACIHNQEKGSDVGNFKAVLHNGELLVGTNKKTSLVPAGKGPFDSFIEAGIDALFHDKAHLRKSWDLGSTLEFFEKYNGLGYRKKGLPTPYLWSMTDQYEKGHFGEKVVNGKAKSTFYPNTVNQNYGVAAVLIALGAFDDSAPASAPLPAKPSEKKPSDEILLRSAIAAGVPEKQVRRAIAFRDKTKPGKDLTNWGFIDYGKPSSEKRGFCVNAKTGEVISFLVAHGSGSDPKKTGRLQKFSNESGSLCTSEGIFLCAESRFCDTHGYEMLLDGMESTNSRARSRAIVFHKATYVSDSYVKRQGRTGNSSGCPAVDAKICTLLIDKFKGGSILVSYR